MSIYFFIICTIQHRIRSILKICRKVMKLCSLSVILLNLTWFPVRNVINSTNIMSPIKKPPMKCQFKNTTAENATYRISTITDNTTENITV